MVMRAMIALALVLYQKRACECGWCWDVTLPHVHYSVFLSPPPPISGFCFLKETGSLWNFYFLCVSIIGSVLVFSIKILFSSFFWSHYCCAVMHRHWCNWDLMFGTVILCWCEVKSKTKQTNKNKTPGSDGRLSDCCDHCARSLNLSIVSTICGGVGSGADGEMLVLSAEQMNYTGGLMSFSFEEPSTVIQPLLLRPSTTGDLKCAAVVNYNFVNCYLTILSVSPEQT